MEAEYIYYGDITSGQLVTREQIKNQLKRRCFDYYTHLHIGQMLIRPDARYKDKEITYESKRNRVVLFWPHLKEDIAYINHTFRKGTY